MNKKMIIYMPKLSVGGMEKALVNLLNMSDLTKKYKILLYLGYSTEKKYLDDIPEDVEIKLLCKGKWNLFGKILCLIKMIGTYLYLTITRKKYDCAISYAYQHGILAMLARKSSDNNIIFIHNDLLSSRTDKELKKMKKRLKFDLFKKVVCVSDKALDSFKKIYPDYKGKVVSIYNYIDGATILKKSNEKVNDIKKESITTFINIGRHEEKAKKITRIIEASNILIKKGYKFRVILVGDGQDHNLYIDLIKKYNLENTVILLGKKVNPYPYLKLSDCFVLSSQYEGYGIVIDEARILGVPVISTDVADAKKIMNEGFGILCDNSEEGIINGMKSFLEKGYKIKNKFDYNRFNDEITEKLNDFVGV